jgi:hypothetical protein
MPQTVYNRDAVFGIPGQPFSSGFADWIESRPALTAMNINFGTLVELVVVSGKEYVQMVQSATTGGTAFAKAFGVSMYDPAREQALPALSPSTGIAGNAFYAPGEPVPIMRRGTIWVLTDGAAAWSGALWPSLGAVNAWHSSTGVDLQGVFTMKAAQTTAGHEIDIVPTTIIGRESEKVQTYTNAWGAVFNVAVVELNAPGAT